MTPEVQDALPFIVSAASVGAIGAVLEASAKGRIAANTQSLVSEYGPIAESQPVSRLRKFGGALLVAGVGLGFLNGFAWQSESTVHNIPPKLEIVVDHSGATGLGGGSAAHEITELVNLFDDEAKIDAQAFIASSGEVQQTAPNKVSQNLPFGNAPLYRATKSALDQAGLNKAEGNASVQQKSNGVLVLTNGNRINPSTSIIKEAKSEGVPVFVVNVEAAKTKVDTTDQLKSIAKQSGGKYWDANKNNINQVGKVVKDELVPQNVDTQDHPNRWPMRGVAAVVTAATLGGLFKRRRSMTLGNEVK